MFAGLPAAGQGLSPLPSASGSADHPVMTGTNPPVYVSIYEQRVKLVADAIVEHSTLDRSVALEVARHVLYALDHIPEKIR